MAMVLWLEIAVGPSSAGQAGVSQEAIYQKMKKLQLEFNSFCLWLTQCQLLIKDIKTKCYTDPKITLELIDDDLFLVLGRERGRRCD